WHRRLHRPKWSQTGIAQRRLSASAGIDRQVEAQAAGGAIDSDLAEPRLLRDPAHPLVRAQVLQQAGARRLADLQGQSVGVRVGQQRGLAVVEQVDVGLDLLALDLAQPKDAERYPWISRRARDVDRRPITAGLA